MCIFGFFLSKFGCYGNSLCYLKIFVSILEYADLVNLTIHTNIVCISCRPTELKSAILVYFCLILVVITLPWLP